MTKARLIALLAFGCVVAAFPACRRASVGRTYPASAIFTERFQLAEFTENSVRVTVALETDVEGQALLRATFSPTEPELHLYGKDMPETGVNGIGVPTRIELQSQGDIKPAGPVFADVPAHDLGVDVLGVTLPIYPEGPVTLRLPVDLLRPGGDLAIHLAVSYMACKANGQCKFPVRNKIVTFTLPKTP